MNTIRLTRRPDVEILNARLEFDCDGAKRVYVDSWPRRILVDKYLIENADAQYLRREDDQLYFTVDNGSAVYRLVSESPGSPISEWEGIEWRL